MTCSAPACRARAKYTINFDIADSVLHITGEQWYQCDDREYCPKHMVEQLDFLMTLVSENEKAMEIKK